MYDLVSTSLPVYEEGAKENWVEPEFVPQCLLSDLRNCIVENFSG